MSIKTAITSTDISPQLGLRIFISYSSFLDFHKQTDNSNDHSDESNHQCNHIKNPPWPKM